MEPEVDSRIMGDCETVELNGDQCFSNVVVSKLSICSVLFYLYMYE